MPRCPECRGNVSRVIDSRPQEVGALSAIMRRRTCSRGHRFTTLEIVAPPVPPKRAFGPNKTPALEVLAEILARGNP
jgi:hypothetical protein